MVIWSEGLEALGLAGEDWGPTVHGTYAELAAGWRGSVALPSKRDLTDAYDAGQAARDIEIRNRRREQIYVEEGASLQNIGEAMAESAEGRPAKLDALKANRDRARARPDWPT